MSHEIAPLNEYIDSEQFRKDIDIDQTDINTALSKQASLYAYYASQAVRARRQMDASKRLLEVTEAALNKKYRQELATTDDKGKITKPTEPQITAAIHTNTTYLRLSERVLDAIQIFKLAEVAEKAFADRKDTALQIARNMLKEQDGPLRVMANQDAKTSRERLLETMKSRIATVTPD